MCCVGKPASRISQTDVAREAVSKPVMTEHGFMKVLVDDYVGKYMRYLLVHNVYVSFYLK